MTSSAGQPGLDAIEQSGDRLAERGDHEAAIEAYKRALFLLGDDRGPRRVELYVKLGEQSAAVGKPRVALNNYLKALRLDVLHVRAYQGSVSLLLAAGELDEVEALQAQRIEALKSEADRVEAYRAYATLWLDYVKDVRRGLAALGQLLALRPQDADGLGRLAITWERLGDVGRAIEVYSLLAAGLRGSEAAAVFKYAAELARDKKGDRNEAIGLAERAVFADPNGAGLVEMLEPLLDDPANARRLSAIYDFVLAHSKDPNRALEIARKLGALAKGALRDLPLAERALLRAVELEGDDPDLLRSLAVVQAAQAGYDRALATCRASVVMAPREPAGHRLSLGIFERMGDLDAARLSAAVLEVLGDADPREKNLAAALRQDGLLPVRTGLAEEDWYTGRLFPERDPTVHALLVRVSSAAIQAKLEVMQREKRTVALNPEERQDIEASTAMLARALLWTAKVLAAPVPALYLRNEAPSFIEHPAAFDPTIVASRSLGSGLSPRQLAFLWGRALCTLRPEHHIAVFFPTVDDLARLLETLGDLARAARPAAARGTLLSALEKGIAPSERGALAERLALIGDARGAAARWFASYELCATRVGLLCCGDLAMSASLIASHPFGSVSTRDEQLGDLLLWVAGDAHRYLRQRLGVSTS